MRTPFDKIQEPPKSVPVPKPELFTDSVVLPASGVAAVLRGLRGRCPRCGGSSLFLRFLKPIPHCPQCGQDWGHQQADDFPAYVSIFVTGHLLAPLIIPLARDTDLSLMALMAIVLPLALILMIGLLQPAKGAIIALQWWFGMHGFRKERRAGPRTTLSCEPNLVASSPLTRSDIRDGSDTPTSK
ncbi:DUF983 domain-containing protein [Altererythrobacter sp. Root672]|uniref:DUF983 domain-containing protein n=1 Tax=Altererythrobacter sp. Root672 TaxID=1736584 RepID=UPI0009EBDE62|nr:DUF983 domain-containing protein [Altererythrobacter sp. Root672]